MAATDVITAAEMLAAKNPVDMSVWLAGHMDGFRTGPHQMYFIATAAARQHKLRSPTDGEWFKTGGCPIYDDMPDFPYECAERFAGRESYAKSYMGWPVNATFYGGKVYLHFKYMGLTLSGAHSDDTCAHFFIPEGKGKRAAPLLRVVYLMFRNLFTAGVSTTLVLNRLVTEATAVVSPFARAMRLRSLSMEVASPHFLVPRADKVQRSIRTGTFEFFCEGAVGSVSRLMTAIREGIDREAPAVEGSGCSWDPSATQEPVPSVPLVLPLPSMASKTESFTLPPLGELMLAVV